MKTSSVPAMDLRRRAGDLLARVRYAGERFVIEKNGEPVAALVGIGDLEHLESRHEEIQQQRASRRQALVLAQNLRQTVLARRGGEPLPDTTDDIRRMREERSSERAGLR